MGSHILVLHPGSHVKAGEEVGIKQIIRGLNMVLDDNDDDVVYRTGNNGRQGQ